LIKIDNGVLYCHEELSLLTVGDCIVRDSEGLLLHYDSKTRIKSEPSLPSSSDIDIDNTVSLCVFGRYEPFNVTILSIAFEKMLR
jgi:hypothetical protein